LLLRLMLLLLPIHLEKFNDLKKNNLKNFKNEYPENIWKVQVGYRILKRTIHSKQKFQ